MTEGVKTCVVCVSGGMDSLVALAVARTECARAAVLHVSYGQRTAARERRAFEAIADHYDISGGLRLAADVGYLAAIGGSSLTDGRIEVAEANLASRDIPTSYVPFRNAHLVSIAASWAEVLGAGRIYVGAMEEDSSGYPDCRRAFFDAMERAIDLGTRPETRIEIRTPLIALAKADVVRCGAELGTPFELSWSCYRSDEAACGRCDSCALRLRGFREAGVTDPIPYEDES